MSVDMITKRTARAAEIQKHEPLLDQGFYVQLQDSLSGKAYAKIGDRGNGQAAVGYNVHSVHTAVIINVNW